MKNFQGNTANDVWLQIFKIIKDQGGIQRVNSRLGDTIELLHVGLTINEPTQRWIPSRIPAINPAFALAEVIWIVNGSNDSQIINFWNNSLPKYAGNTCKYHGAYGFRIRRHFNIDQLERAYYALQYNETSRQVVIQIWDPVYDLPDFKGHPVSQDIPCNLSSMLKIRNNRLEWMQINRSNDIFRGLPYNIVQFTTLQELMASWLRIEIGTYNQLSDSIHLYYSDLDEIDCDDNSPIFLNTDKINLSYEESKIFFKAIFEKIEFIVNNRLSESKFFDFFNEELKVKALDNILLVLGAEAARRHKYIDISNKLMENCSNPIFKLLWKNWINRYTTYPQQTKLA